MEYDLKHISFFKQGIIENKQSETISPKFKGVALLWNWTDVPFYFHSA